MIVEGYENIQEALKIIHKRFYGLDDKYLEENEEQLNTNSFQSERILHSMAVTYYPDKNQIKHTFMYEGEDCGFTNFRVEPASAIQTMCLFQGGMIAERISLFHELGETPRFDSMDNGKIIPSLKHHSYEILLILKDNSTPVQISYDTVLLKATEKQVYSLLKQEQMELYSFHQRMMLPFNHPLIDIFVFIQSKTTQQNYFDEVQSISLTLEGEFTLIPEKKDNYFLFHFGDKTSFNCSYAPSSRLQIKMKYENTDDYQVKIYGINKHLLLYHLEKENGALGLLFAK